ncbi:SDR family oxidoreductase [Kribbella shirazensis]|uniref:NAD(P)-dependent dehydrogenase (Short-subunit alcohol dehydrogenase family) n=1 Tax=Kribbella shirazensis TaxID=1105143 RepID=A0A7X6A4W4_9ACTN|nr:SDR family oxidoreductase [Kribbella shirazensis]NIK61896.1 NAD(P)-dependent dehydrogenase (short-subunit alcohol dehydrogenase family) [Kribbella shirazensis]
MMQRDDGLKGQLVVVLGGSSGIGLETARLAGAAGARLVLTARNRERLEEAAGDVGADTVATVDLGDPPAVDAFFAGLPRIDHVLVSGSGPFYAPIMDLDFEQARRFVDEHVVGALRIARLCSGRVRGGGSLTFISGTGARRPGVGLSMAAIATVALSALTANAALELAPLRVNAVAAGFVDTPLSARLLGEGLDERRAELRATLPIGRVVGPQDVAGLIVHLMTNSALTGATYDVDGGQQLLRN